MYLEKGMSDSIINILEEEFGEEWTTYKRGNFIHIRAIIISLFIELVTQRKIFKEKYSTIESFYEKYADNDIILQAIEKDNGEPALSAFVNVSDNVNKIIDDYIKIIVQSEKLDINREQISVIKKVLVPLVELAKSKKDLISKYVIEEESISEMTNHEKAKPNSLSCKNISMDNPILHKFCKIANYTDVCKKFFSSESNIGLMLLVATKLSDGFNSEFKNGGCPTIHTQAREIIVRDTADYVQKPRKKTFSGKRSYSDLDWVKPKNKNKKQKKSKKDLDYVWIYSDDPIVSTKKDIVIPTSNQEIVLGPEKKFSLEESEIIQPKKSGLLDNILMPPNIFLVEESKEDENEVEEIEEIQESDRSNLTFNSNSNFEMLIKALNNIGNKETNSNVFGRFLTNPSFSSDFSNIFN